MGAIACWLWEPRVRSAGGGTWLLKRFGFGAEARPPAVNAVEATDYVPGTALEHFAATSETRVCAVCNSMPSICVRFTPVIRQRVIRKVFIERRLEAPMLRKQPSLSVNGHRQSGGHRNAALSLLGTSAGLPGLSGGGWWCLGGRVPYLGQAWGV
jgi:hypothetical protein